VNDNTPVAEECANALGGRGELVIVRNLEGIRRDAAVLAAQIANLAGLREPRVARRVLAAEKRIQVGQRLGAVAVAGDRVDVDMVDCEEPLAMFRANGFSGRPRV
jgi:hypothetical protein